MPWTAGPTAIALVLAIAVAAALAFGPSAGALDCEGVALDDGCLFTITGGDTAEPDDGFAVTNADGVPLWDFVRERDLQAIGYPISQRWVRGPFTLQAFQKVILQWDSGKQRMNYYNTLDVLANRYPEVELPNVPPHQVLEADRGADFATITRNHLALLDQNAEIKERFLREPDWLNLYGLPISYEEQEVNGHPQGLQMLRAQRTVFVIWNVPAPGTTVGRVNLQNVPDKVKKLSNVIIPDAAEAPLFAHAVAQLPVFSLTLPDPIPPTQVSLPVGELAQRNRRLQPYVDQMPWLVDYVFPWLTDGIDSRNFQILDQLLAIAQSHEDLAMFLARTPWFADGIDQGVRCGPRCQRRSDEEFALKVFRDLPIKTPALVPIVLTYSWLADDLTGREAGIVKRLMSISEYDLDLALLTARAPWLTDSVADYEASAVYHVLEIARFDPPVAKQWLSYSLSHPTMASDIYLITYIYHLRQSKPDRYHQLVHQPWYLDGLSPQERAFIITLTSVASDDFYRLLTSYHAQSLTVSLPLTGEITLWAFQLDPFPAGEELLAMGAETVRWAEHFMGVPFPTNSIIYFFVRYQDIFGGAESAGMNFEHEKIRIVREAFPRFTRDSDYSRYAIYHDTSHYYFVRLGPSYPDHLATPTWLDEGGANFMASYINEKMGFQGAADRLHETATNAQEQCARHGYPKIQQLTVPRQSGSSGWNIPFYRCTYILGEYLLLSLYFAMGESGLSAALRELYWREAHGLPDRTGESFGPPTDLEVFQTFLKHTPPGREDAVRDVYRRIHGGFAADPSVFP